MEQTTKDQLRASAERRLTQQPPAWIQTDRDHLVLAHELAVHQVELEMQNELLAESFNEAASARDKYQALYDLAPVGFVTLNLNGEVIEANQKCGEMLGMDVRTLPGRQLREFFGDTSVARFDELLQMVWAKVHDVSGQELLLRGRSYKHLPIYVNIKARAGLDRSTHELLAQLVLMDVSREKLAVEDATRALKNSGFGNLE